MNLLRVVLEEISEGFPRGNLDEISDGISDERLKNKKNH